MAAKDLETRIQILEDMEEIKKVKARYIYYMDAAFADPSSMLKLVKLFTKDAFVDFQGVAVCKGTDEIKTFFTKTFLDKFSFTHHMIHSPLVEVNGNKATGEWYVQVPLTVRKTNQAVWAEGKYTNEFVKEGGEWKISKIIERSAFEALYEDGWAGKSVMKGWVKP